MSVQKPLRQYMYACAKVLTPKSVTSLDKEIARQKYETLNNTLCGIFDNALSACTGVFGHVHASQFASGMLDSGTLKVVGAAGECNKNLVPKSLRQNACVKTPCVKTPYPKHYAMRQHNCTDSRSPLASVKK
jgi:hypothetical protein